MTTNTKKKHTIKKADISYYKNQNIIMKKIKIKEKSIEEINTII